MVAGSGYIGVKGIRRISRFRCKARASLNFNRILRGYRYMTRMVYIDLAEVVNCAEAMSCGYWLGRARALKLCEVW